MTAQGIRVVVTDLETGETQTAEIMDEYILVCAGTCHVAYQQAYGNGTVQLTIKGRATQDMRLRDARKERDG